MYTYMGSILMRELKNLSYESISNNMFANDHTTLNNNSSISKEKIESLNLRGFLKANSHYKNNDIIHEFENRISSSHICYRECG